MYSANLPLVFKFLMKYKANYDIITMKTKIREFCNYAHLRSFWLVKGVVYSCFEVRSQIKNPQLLFFYLIFENCVGVIFQSFLKDYFGLTLVLFLNFMTTNLKMQDNFFSFEIWQWKCGQEKFENRNIRQIMPQ